MKGYAWVNISDEMREALAAYLQERTNFVRDFEIAHMPRYKKTRRGWFGRIETYYDLTDVQYPDGIFMWGASPHIADWLNELTRLARALHTDRVLLDEKAINGLMDAIPNEFKEANK